MKSGAMMLLQPLGARLALGLACTLLVGAGWTARISLMQLDAISNGMVDTLEQPSPTFLRSQINKAVLTTVQAPKEIQPSVQTAARRIE